MSICSFAGDAFTRDSGILHYDQVFVDSLQEGVGVLHQAPFMIRANAVMIIHEIKYYYSALFDRMRTMDSNVIRGMHVQSNQFVRVINKTCSKLTRYSDLCSLKSIRDRLSFQLFCSFGFGIPTSLHRVKVLELHQAIFGLKSGLYAFVRLFQKSDISDIYMRQFVCSCYNKITRFSESLRLTVTDLVHPACLFRCAMWTASPSLTHSYKMMQIRVSTQESSAPPYLSKTRLLSWEEQASEDICNTMCLSAHWFRYEHGCSTDLDSSNLYSHMFTSRIPHDVPRSSNFHFSGCRCTYLCHIKEWIYFAFDFLCSDLHALTSEAITSDPDFYTPSMFTTSHGIRSCISLAKYDKPMPDWFESMITSTRHCIRQPIIYSEQGSRGRKCLHLLLRKAFFYFYASDCVSTCANSKENIMSNFWMYKARTNSCHQSNNPVSFHHDANARATKSADDSDTSSIISTLTLPAFGNCLDHKIITLVGSLIWINAPLSPSWIIVFIDHGVQRMSYSVEADQTYWQVIIVKLIWVRLLHDLKYRSQEMVGGIDTSHGHGVSQAFTRVYVVLIRFLDAEFPTTPSCCSSREHVNKYYFYRCHPLVCSTVVAQCHVSNHMLSEERSREHDATCMRGSLLFFCCSASSITFLQLFAFALLEWRCHFINTRQLCSYQQLTLCWISVSVKKFILTLALPVTLLQQTPRYYLSVNSLHMLVVFSEFGFRVNAQTTTLCSNAMKGLMAYAYENCNLPELSAEPPRRSASIKYPWYMVHNSDMLTASFILRHLPSPANGLFQFCMWNQKELPPESILYTSLEFKTIQINKFVLPKSVELLNGLFRVQFTI
eukprot:scaffold88362_cov26-Cyclotella_meneghiniana.AAC.1